MKKVLLVVLFSLVASGCASTSQVEQQQATLAEQQRKLEKFEELRPAIARNAASIDSLNKRIATLEGRLDELQRRLEVPSATPYPQAPEDPFAEREGATPPGMEGVDQMTGRPQQPQQPTGQQPSFADQQAQAPQQPAEPADPAQALYDKALKEFNERNYQAAQANWKKFSEQYKDNPLVPNALFWQGESFYQMRDYPKAILAYQEIIGKHPKSPKYPAALLKQGISFIIIGKKDAGRLVLNDVIEKFPGTPEARRAKEFLSNAN